MLSTKKIIHCTGRSISMEKLKTFFWYCSGADTKLLQQCESESSKYVGIGATIFFTGLFAALSAAYAFFTVFDSYLIASLLGLVWGLMIFNLDRFIVSSMRKSGKFWSEFAVAAPRLLLAVLISIVIAKPLELKIFEKEINAELALMTEEMFAEQEQLVKSKYMTQTETLKAEISQLKQEIEQKVAKRDELARIAQQEADGTGGTGKRNPGPIYKIKKADADKVEAELQALSTTNLTLIQEKQDRLNGLDSLSNAELASLQKTAIGGPAARLEALSRLTVDSEAIWMSNIFIILLFIVVETSPIFVKLISKKGPYDYLLETTEYKYETAIIKDKAYIHSELKKEAEAFSATEKKFVDTRLDVRLDNV